ncbi:MAG: peptide ABC transporter substrate-binding protein [Candidatus Moranbacteria bacterium]|nr:peptide ABC transporter substrate-binding protein [Candidatus Moranbacteria bacterium]
MITWRKISQNLSNKERIIVGWLILIAAVSLVVSAAAFYYHYTKSVPIAGGDYTEGIVGQPLYVNPVLAAGNDADADLCALIYSGLFKYDADGKIVPDLVESYEVSDDKLAYIMHLKKDIKWHDGEPFTAEDVLFTVQAIQDPAFKSPLRQSWQGVGVEMVDDSTIRFLLQSPYAFFLNNLSIGILPKHIWETIAPGNYPLAEYNLRPVGTGPYKFINFEKDGEGNILSYELRANENYYSDQPYISNFNLSFYYDEDSIIEAYNNKQIFGMSYVSPSKIAEIKSKRSSDIHSINIPRYFAAFFNQQKSKVLANREVRKALSMAVDRQALIREVLFGEGKEIYSPIPPGAFGFTDDVKKFSFDIEKANKTLDDDGWKKGDDGFRKKDNQALEFKLTTTDWPDLIQTAELLKKEWEAIGAKVEYEALPVADIQQNFIRPREYEALLFGQMLGIDPDPFAFWHSSQTRDPGMNLALYSNPDVDKILEKTRQEMDPAGRLDYYKKFQQTIADDVPATFLYSPNYLYVTSKKVQGVSINSMTTPDKRFSGVAKWYVKTKRVKK